MWTHYCYFHVKVTLKGVCIQTRLITPIWTVHTHAHTHTHTHTTTNTHTPPPTHTHTHQHTHTHTHTTTNTHHHTHTQPYKCMNTCAVGALCCGVWGCDLKWHLTGFPGHQTWCMPGQWASSTLSVVPAWDETGWRFHLSPLSQIELALMNWPHWPPFWLPWDSSTMYLSNGSYKVLWRVCVGVSPVVVTGVPAIWIIIAIYVWDAAYSLGEGKGRVWIWTAGVNLSVVIIVFWESVRLDRKVRWRGENHSLAIQIPALLIWLWSHGHDGLVHSRWPSPPPITLGPEMHINVIPNLIIMELGHFLSALIFETDQRIHSRHKWHC